MNDSETKIRYIVIDRCISCAYISPRTGRCQVQPAICIQLRDELNKLGGNRTKWLNIRLKVNKLWDQDAVKAIIASYKIQYPQLKIKLQGERKYET